jgi:eukaryotic-like serine/threonine-protein kinase
LGVAILTNEMPVHAGDPDISMELGKILLTQEMRRDARPILKWGALPLPSKGGMNSAAPPQLTQPGSRIGRYELVRWLGEGGFAEVWLAQDLEDMSAPHVAIKVMRRGRARDARQKKMFLDEAHLAERIQHPNVARVFEIGDVEGSLFIAMEYVQGGSLDALIEGAQALGEPVPPAIALRLMADACAGLHAAHELTIDGRPQHVIHRDVSPQNILLTTDGIPKLIDFGIAKARERIAKETSTGVTKGKVSYMSPEQARGVPLDRRADVWAIGAVLYELLEGRRLLEGPNEVARLQALVSRPIMPTFERTPPAATGLIERALAFYPADRQATAEELRADIERAIEASGLVTTTEEIRTYCQRARVAADAAVPSEEHPPAPELGDLLAQRMAEPTVSVILPSTVSGRPAVVRERSGGRMIVGGLAVLIVALVGFVATRGVSPTASPPPPSPPQVEALGTPAGPASAVVASPQTTSSPPPPPSTAALASTKPSAPPRVVTPPKSPPPAHTAPATTVPKRNDDDQIE